jgi:hypothetical protein
MFLSPETRPKSTITGKFARLPALTRLSTACQSAGS